MVEVGKWCTGAGAGAGNVVLMRSSDIKVAGAKP